MPHSVVATVRSFAGIFLPRGNKATGRAAVLLLCLGCVFAKGAFAADASPELHHAFFFVATNGNDAWSGTRAQLSPSTTNGPFATVQRAIDAGRAWRKSPGVASNAVVGIFLREGTYFLNQPVVLKADDSGMVLSSYKTEKPLLSGGRRITGWKPVVVNGKNAWAADIPAARNNKWVFHQLWVNGQRAARARYPKKGFLKVAEVPDKTADWMHGNTRFRFNPGELKLWSNINQGEVIVTRAWTESRLPIASLDEANRFVSFKKRSVLPLRAGDAYWLEGALEFLEQPGEWCLDSAAGVLYYLPLPGQIMSNVEVVAPLLSQLVRLEGNPATGDYIERVRFKGLTFSHTEWYFPEGFANTFINISPRPSPEIGGFAQSEIGVPGALWGQGVHACSWKACTFKELGDYGLELGFGCISNLVSHCTFSDLGAGGVKFGQTYETKKPWDDTRDNEVSDCDIHDGGKLFFGANGVWVGISGGNRIIHNDIYDFYYSGISIGWTWGYFPTPTTNNLIAFNHVHHIGGKSDSQGAIMSDLGGIYTLGVQPGTRILNNLVHDVAALTTPGIGIYLDEGSSGMLIQSNVVYRTTDCGFGLHYGATNGVINNIFAFGRDRQLRRHQPESHLSLIFFHNIIYFDSGVVLDGAWDPKECRVDSNLYFDVRPGAGGDRRIFNNLTWQQWRASGHDQNSYIADPLFDNPLHYDFRLSSGSPASKIAFDVIDLSNVGVRR